MTTQVASAVPADVWAGRRSLSVKELAALHGLSATTVWSLIREGELVAVKLTGGTTRILREHAEAWEAGLQRRDGKAVAHYEARRGGRAA